MPSKRKNGTKSKQKGSRPKSGSRLPALEEKGRRDKAFEVFLKAYSRTGRKHDSAEMAGVSCRSIQKWRDEFPEFEEAFQSAHGKWADLLKSEVFRRAVDGWEEPVYYKGEMVGTIRKYDSNLLMFLMKQADSSFKENYQTQVNVANRVNQTTIHGNVTIIEDSDWYGNRAHDMASEAVTAQSPGAHVPCEVQVVGLRETVEQDGNDDVGGTEGARDEERAIRRSA